MHEEPSAPRKPLARVSFIPFYQAISPVRVTLLSIAIGRMLLGFGSRAVPVSLGPRSSLWWDSVSLCCLILRFPFQACGRLGAPQCSGTLKTFNTGCRVEVGQLAVPSQRGDLRSAASELWQNKTTSCPHISRLDRLVFGHLLVFWTSPVIPELQPGSKRQDNVLLL